MRLSETDKHFLFSLVFAGGIILFWRGIWGIADIVPVVNNVFMSFFLGLLVLTLTGLIYREFDPLEQKIGLISRIMEHVASDKKKHEYEIVYFDEIRDKEFKINGSRLIKKEFGYVTMKHEGNEFFIPVRRVTQVTHKGKVMWKK